jgi:hypothetical protein
MNVLSQSNLKVDTAVDMRISNPEEFRICLYFHKQQRADRMKENISTNHSTQSTISLRLLCKTLKIKNVK